MAFFATPRKKTDRIIRENLLAQLTTTFTEKDIADVKVALKYSDDAILDEFGIKHAILKLWYCNSIKKEKDKKIFDFLADYINVEKSIIGPNEKVEWLLNNNYTENELNSNPIVTYMTKDYTNQSQILKEKEWKMFILNKNAPHLDKEIVEDYQKMITNNYNAKRKSLIR